MTRIRGAPLRWIVAESLFPSLPSPANRPAPAEAGPAGGLRLHHYSLVVDGQRYQDAAWFYAEPTSDAWHIRDHAAFWRGVRIEA